MERPGVATDLLTVHIEESISLRLNRGATAVINWKLVNYVFACTEEPLLVLVKTLGLPSVLVCVSFTYVGLCSRMFGGKVKGRVIRGDVAHLYSLAYLYLRWLPGLIF